ncbi:hypothetical protein GCM10027406_08030 [Leifsonia lichenia]
MVAHDELPVAIVIHGVTRTAGQSESRSLKQTQQRRLAEGNKIAGVYGIFGV